MPTNARGYEVDYWVNNQVGYCENKSLLFESMNLYNTNCYGLAINYWTYNVQNHPNIDPGMCVDNVDYEKNYQTCAEIAEYVKHDFNYWGEEVQILTGENNTPYYYTDDKHSLIAVRTMSEKDYSSGGKMFKISRKLHII